MKKAKWFVALLMAIVLVLPVAAAGERGKIVVTVEGEVKPGNEIQVIVEMVSNPGVTAMEILPEYDKSVLELKSIQGNPPQGCTWMTGNQNNMLYMNPTQENIDFTGIMLTYTYLVLDNAPSGSSTVSVAVSEAVEVDVDKDEEFPVEYDVVPATITIACNHVSDGGTVTKEPTCQKTGEKVFKCTKCSEVIKTETIAKLEHKEDAGTVTKEASCTEAGEKVFKCTVGGETLRTETIPALGHKEDKGTVTKEPTCTETGQKTFRCTVCQEVLRTETIEALGHDWEETVEKEATCQEAGVKVKTCKNCHETKKETIEKLEHKWETGEVIQAADCENPGKQSEKCSVCQETREAEIPALGHQWDEGKIVKEAEEGQPGLKIYTCLNDETHTREEEIPAIEEKTELPDVVGMTIDEALEVLESLGLTTPIRVTPDASMDKDAPLAPDCVVTEMVPAAGEMITKDTEIKLTIKAPEGEDPANPVDGPATPPVEDLKKVVLPNVIGKSIEDSSGAIANLGLKWEWPQGIPADINYVITEMKPAAGETVPEGTVVQLFYTTEISKTSESTPEAASPATPAVDVPTAPAATPVAPAMGDPACIALWVSLLLGSGGTAMLFGKKRG